MPGRRMAEAAAMGVRGMICCPESTARALSAYPKSCTSGIPMPLIPTHRDASVTFFGQALNGVVRWWIRCLRD